MRELSWYRWTQGAVTIAAGSNLSVSLDMNSTNARINPFPPNTNRGGKVLLEQMNLFYNTKTSHGVNVILFSGTTATSVVATDMYIDHENIAKADWLIMVASTKPLRAAKSGLNIPWWDQSGGGQLHFRLHNASLATVIPPSTLRIDFGLRPDWGSPF